MLSILSAPAGWLCAGQADRAAPRLPDGRGRSFEVRPGIYLVDGLDADLPMDDLAALREMVGDADVVALGESVHTSGGYYRAKHRLFRFLVEDLGFRAFAFESPWTDAELVKHYVDTCEGTAPDAVLGGLFGVWASRSVVKMVEWMCTYNQTNPDDPVTFWGFDIQQPWHDGRLLVSYLEDAVAEPGDMVAGVLRCNGATSTSASDYYLDPDSQFMDEADHGACVGALNAVQSYFDEHEAELVAGTSAEELAWARLSLVSLRAWEFEVFFGDDHARSSSARDEGMALVFQAMKQLRNPDDRVAVWAHNWHIAYRTDEMNPQVGLSMGSHLRQALGDSYFAIGLVGYAVSIQWPGVYSGLLPLPEDPNEVELMLHRDLGHAYLLVDLSFADADEPYLVTGRQYIVSGFWAVPADQYGALFYLDVSPPRDLDLWH
jgi:erythromycin esterase